MSEWSKGFKQFCLNKLSKEDMELWGDVKLKLSHSIECGENLFPRTVVGTVVVTLNGRILTTIGEEEGKEVKYIFGLNPDDLLASNGNVRLNSKFTKKKFETKDNPNSQKSYAFMLSFIRALRVDAFIDSIRLKADVNSLKGKLSKFKIPEIQVNSNPTLCTLDLITGDYNLAINHKKDFLDCVSWKDASMGGEIEGYLNTMLEINKVDSISDSIEYYLKRGSRKHSLRSEFTTFLTLEKGLTDIVPVAIRFPNAELRTLDSGINLVNNLDNYIFDVLCGRNNKLSLSMLNLYLANSDSNYHEQISRDFFSKFTEFQKSVQRKVFSAPSLSSSYGDVVEVACASKKDIYELTDIQFNNYSFGIMNFILSCILREELGKILPYSLVRTEGSPFNQYLRMQIKSREREANEM